MSASRRFERYMEHLAAWLGSVDNQASQITAAVNATKDENR